MEDEKIVCPWKPNYWWFKKTYVTVVFFDILDYEKSEIINMLQNQYQ